MQLVILFSKSDNTEELLRLVPYARAKGAHLVAVTSMEGNMLAPVCDSNVHLPVERELCPFDLAPVTSTTIQMVFGDTMVIALMGARNLSKKKYATNHPAGRIGKNLIFKLVELTSKGCGCLLVIDPDYHLIGTFTDGDLRRTLNASREGIFKLIVGEMCNRNPRTIGPDAMAVEAMKKTKSPSWPV
ncbi:Probable arabinose 5-phosphate isomerase [Linum perenne]